MSTALEQPAPDLHLRLSEAGSEELLALLRAHAGELTAAAVRHALRNPYCTAEAIEEIAGAQRLLSFYEVRRDLALHPRTPEALAARLVPTLWWRDLVALALDTPLRPGFPRTGGIPPNAPPPGDGGG